MLDVMFRIKWIFGKRRHAFVPFCFAWYGGRNFAFDLLGYASAEGQEYWMVFGLINGYQDVGRTYGWSIMIFGKRFQHLIPEWDLIRFQKKRKWVLI